jgi:hypothetical protein
MEGQVGPLRLPGEGAVGGAGATETSQVLDGEPLQLDALTDYAVQEFRPPPLLICTELVLQVDLHVFQLLEQLRESSHAVQHLDVPGAAKRGVAEIQTQRADCRVSKCGVVLWNGGG